MRRLGELTTKTWEAAENIRSVNVMQQERMVKIQDMEEVLDRTTAEQLKTMKHTTKVLEKVQALNQPPRAKEKRDKEDKFRHGPDRGRRRKQRRRGQRGGGKGGRDRRTKHQNDNIRQRAVTPPNQVPASSGREQK